jgi:hypothetical protein
VRYSEVENTPALQPGHFPIHLGLSNPQDLQKNVVLALVMVVVV